MARVLLSIAFSMASALSMSTKRVSMPKRGNCTLNCRRVSHVAQPVAPFQKCDSGLDRTWLYVPP